MSNACPENLNCEVCDSSLDLTEPQNQDLVEVRNICDDCLTNSDNAVNADENYCHECGWNETPATKNYRKCPECEAPFLTKYIQRTFGRIASDQSSSTGNHE